MFVVARLRERVTCDDTPALARRAAHHDALGPQAPRPDLSGADRAGPGVPGGGAAGADREQSQGWHWLVVTDPELRAADRRVLQAVLRRVPRLAAARPSARPDPGEPTQQRVASSADYLADHMGEVPVLVLACIEAAAELPAENQAGLWGRCSRGVELPARRPRPRPGYGLDDAAPALRGRGLRAARDPAARAPGVLLPTAYYTGETFRPAPREPLERVLHLDRW